ncbi:RCC1 domain-containing protein [Chitinimonas koreensis]|uniref:RCC1 domain-containing protein n=1 Tax=Chitinimonas koreensis TaxID=356302 RepID=UPI0006881613|nr:hypothetical protein [Chitinimonas koreensis]QNM97629.1 RCC1 repeat- and reductase domain-containing protein [Chitinimonas koreensis]
MKIRGHIGSVCALWLGALPAAAAPTLAVGLDHALAIKHDGAVAGWGINNYGALGTGYLNDAWVPMLAWLEHDAAMVSAGSGFSLALRRDGTVWAWGRNARGQLGLGHTNPSYRPTEIGKLAGVTAIAAGGNHALALKADGTVWAWGSNGNGELGNASGRDAWLPLQVAGLAGVAAVAAADGYSLALKGDGSLWAWGLNSSGQLGQGDSSDRARPVQVTGLPALAAVAAGSRHVAALSRDGRVYSWGWNGDCQLGNSTGPAGNCVASSRPGLVASLAGAKAVAVGDTHTVALKSDGSVWSWGSNAYGQLGNGSATGAGQRSLQPVPADRIRGAEEIAAGAAVTLVRLSGGAVRGMGRNLYGQLGNGETGLGPNPVNLFSALPAPVAGVGGDGALTLGVVYSPQCQDPAAARR